MKMERKSNCAETDDEIAPKQTTKGLRKIRVVPDALCYIIVFVPPGNQR